MALMLKKVDRPRELKWYQASSMLYGDWGTSKAYVLGIAFAIAGHASMFFLLAMGLLTAIIGVCYIFICKAYPDGGGVYSAVRSRSKTLAVIGALLLIADYVITCALSGIEAFHYLGLPHPEWWAIGMLILIGLLNMFGPAKSGNIATVIAALTVTALLVLVAAVLPHLGQVTITLPQGSLVSNWSKFVGIILALSGVEAIANVTGIMEEPVAKTARRAILPVLLEVTIVSLVLGAAMNAIPGLSGHTEDMIRKIATYYVNPVFGKVIAVILGLLLISACNTAMMALISIMFLLSKDKELPPIFSSLNRYGMPWFSLIVAVIVPCVILILEHEVTHLAALYAIGVVGAITINLWACSTNKELSLRRRERWLLGVAAVFMALAEITIILQKHHAVIFALSVLTVGLAARSIAKWYETKRVIEPEVLGVNVVTIEEARDLMPLYRGSTLVAIKALSPSLILEAAIHVKGKKESVVYALYVEEKPPGWAYPNEVEPAREAVSILNQAVEEFEKKGITAVPLWSLSHETGLTIVKTAKSLEIETVMIGTTKRSGFERLMRGEVLKSIMKALPQEKHLIICN